MTRTLCNLIDCHAKLQEEYIALAKKYADEPETVAVLTQSYLETTNNLLVKYDKEFQSDHVSS